MPLTVVAAAVVVVTLPLTVLVAAAFDVVLRRWGFGTVRLIAFVAWYLVVSVVVQVVGLVTWLATGFGTRSQTDRAMAMHYWIIVIWITQMRWALRVLLGLRIEVDHPEFAHPPAVIVARHTSLADVFVPTGLALDAGAWIRVVLTSGLVYEPSLDLFGHRTPQYFIERGAKDMRREVEALVRLTDHFDERTALVIFPEGGLYRPERMAQVIASLERKDPAQAARGRELRHLLPPKSVGFSALLDGAAGADVVVIGHVGFHQLTDGRTIWRSVPLAEPARVTVRRFARAEIPDDAEGRKQWLNDRWDEMDDWIAAQEREPGTALASG